MGNLSYNLVDLEDYGLTVLDGGAENIARAFEAMQLQNKAQGWTSRLKPRGITLPVTIKASSAENIHTVLSQARQYLNQGDACKLALSEIAGRYWWARFTGFTGNLISPKTWAGEVQFAVEDPRAFSTSEDANTHNVPADPTTVVETNGGTAYVEPVILLTAQDTLAVITLKVQNMGTGEELTWDGSLVATNTVEIDVVNYLVKKNGVADMADVAGQFPTLQPGANNIKVTAFGTNGNIKFTYRDAYI